MLYDDEFVKCVFIVLDLSSSSKEWGMGDGEWDEYGGKRRGMRRMELSY
jgi:hypothetical protein